jgi:hypothetical protein
MLFKELPLKYLLPFTFISINLMGMYSNIHTLIAENSLATPVWFQSFPTKGMNCPKTSDLKGKK